MTISSVDFRDIQALPQAERKSVFSGQEGQSLLSNLSPGQIAELFPDYYKENLSFTQKGYFDTLPGVLPNESNPNLPDDLSSDGPNNTPVKRTATPSGQWKTGGNTIDTTATALPGSNTSSTVIATRRAKFADEIAKNPQLRDELEGMMLTEDGQNPIPVLESLMNRMDYTGGTLKGGLHSGFYGPINRGELPRAVSEVQNNPKLKAQMDAAIDAVLAGSNVIKGATDQGLPSDPNGGQTSGRMMINGEVFADFGGGPGGVKGSAAWREQFQSAYETEQAQKLASANTKPTTTEVGLPKTASEANTIIAAASSGSIKPDSPTVDEALKVKGLSDKSDRSQVVDYMKPDGQKSDPSGWQADFINQSVTANTAPMQPTLVADIQSPGTEHSIKPPLTPAQQQFNETLEKSQDPSYKSPVYTPPPTQNKNNSTPIAILGIRGGFDPDNPDDYSKDTFPVANTTPDSGQLIALRQGTDKRGDGEGIPLEGQIKIQSKRATHIIEDNKTEDVSLVARPKNQAGQVDQQPYQKDNNEFNTEKDKEDEPPVPMQQPVNQLPKTTMAMNRNSPSVISVNHPATPNSMKRYFSQNRQQQAVSDTPIGVSNYYDDSVLT